MLLAALGLTLQLAAPADVTTLVGRARSARYQQDSALASYETVVRQRITASIGVKRGLVGQVGRPRLAGRVETVARVGWDHSLGAWAELIAGRSVAPIVGENDAMFSDDDVAVVLPYYPGRDRLWPVMEMREAMREGMRGKRGAAETWNDWIAHPLDHGSDSLYAFSLGDSLSFKLPDASLVRLREVRVRPRRPDAQLIVGSLWVDAASGALVRAAYRPSMEMDLWPFFGEELDDDERPHVKKLGPFLGSVREVIVEHGLYERRFWLPRTRIASAEGTAQIGRMTVAIEQTFTYEKVAALAPGVAYGHRQPEPDIDPRDGRVRRGPWRGVQDETHRCRETDDSSATFGADSLLRDKDLAVMYADGVRVRVLLPCRRSSLLHSRELPGSIYDPGDELFTSTDFNALRKDVEGALSIGSQAEFSPRPTTVHYGIDKGLLRYNRVEGLSAGVAIERVLGGGYTVNALARVGHADLEPNGELTLRRNSSTRDVRVTAYRRLVPANDWGEPLSLGASINSLVLARDDGFYYRAMGGEVTGTLAGAIHKLPVTWRLFAERQDSASIETHESFSRLVSGTRFLPNIPALEGMYFGAKTSAGFALGLDPEGTRTWGALTVEGAGGESSYGRFMLDASFAQGLGRRRLLTLTAAGGTSVGRLPVQRSWLVGGPYTVRGHRPASMSGNSFWLGRAELTQGHPLVRPVLFGDIGWAGSRESRSDTGRPLSGAGLGVAAFDGIVRVDVARGLGDAHKWRLEAYFEIR